MSNTISTPWYTSSPIQTANRLISDSARVRAATDTLTAQASSGKIADTFAGLGAGARVAVNLSPQLARQDVFSANIASAGTRMGATQSALDQLNTIATTFVSGLTGINEATAGTVDSLATQARAALGQVADILNTNLAGTYLFGGADPTNQPVQSSSSIGTSPFVTQITAAVAALGAAGGPATIAATLGAAQASGPALFSSTIGSQPPQVEIGEGKFVSQGILAGTNISAPSTGTNSTGAYATDLMRALATIAGMSSGQVNLAGFDALRQDTLAGLHGSVTAISSDQSVLGSNQQALANASTRIDATKTLLQTRISAVTDVDMAATATKLANLQTQLQASYKLIAGMKDLSLVNYL